MPLLPRWAAAVNALAGRDSQPVLGLEQSQRADHLPLSPQQQHQPGQQASQQQGEQAPGVLLERRLLEGQQASQQQEEEAQGVQRRLLEVWLMLAQLIASSCSTRSIRFWAMGEAENHWSPVALRMAHCAFALRLLPALAGAVLHVLSTHGPELDEQGRRKQLEREARGSGAGAGGRGRAHAVSLWVEWHAALQQLLRLIRSLAEELTAAATAGSTAGEATSIFNTIDCAVEEGAHAAAAAQAAGAWPPRDAGTLAAAAATALRLLGRWHGILQALVPRPAGGEGIAPLVDPQRFSLHSRLAVCAQQWLPDACHKLVAAAAATAKQRVPSVSELHTTLPPLLDAAGTACKLVLLACRDAEHWTLLGAAGVSACVRSASAISSQPGLLPGSGPYSPVELLLQAGGAALDCAARLLASGTLEQEAEYVRR